MNFIESLLTCYKKTFNYSGRASKSEFWWFQLLNFVVFAFLVVYTRSESYEAFAENNLIDILMYIYALKLIPLLSAAVRRFHDMDKSGFMVLWSLVPIVGSLVVLIALMGNGTEGNNKFGPKPKK